MSYLDIVIELSMMFLVGNAPISDPTLVGNTHYYIIGHTLLYNVPQAMCYIYGVARRERRSFCSLSEQLGARKKEN